MLTREKVQEYVHGGYNRCPFCASDDITDTGMIQRDDNWAEGDVECLNCRKTWKDVYVLRDIVATDDRETLWDNVDWLQKFVQYVQEHDPDLDKLATEYADEQYAAVTAGISKEV